VTVDRAIRLACLAACFSLSFSLSTPVPARADRRADPEAAAKEKEAREHYTNGMRHFDLGEIDAAVAEFKEAYKISAAPGLLFNIAQAYRTKKDYEQALLFYKNYLRLVPRAANRADVEARVAEMEKMIAEQERMQRERPVGVLPPQREGEEELEATTPPPTAPIVAPPPPLPPRPRFLSTTGGKVTVALAGLAGLCAITAGALGGVALSTRDDYRSGCDRGTCDDAKYDRAHGLAIGSDVLWGLTAASAVGAIVVGVLTYRSLHKPGVYARGAMLAGSF
jgi:tetratricopeptide (TPR) repeat protein